MTVDLRELQRIAGQYATRSNLLVAGGPLAVATIGRLALGKNKLASLAVAGGGAWFAVHEISGATLGLIRDQFGNLQSVMSGFRG